MPLYAANGTINVTVVSGSSFVGAYAANGSKNIQLAPESGFCGRVAPCGAEYAVNSPEQQQGLYAPNGAIYITDNPNSTSGALHVTVVSGTLPVFIVNDSGALFIDDSSRYFTQ